MTGGFEIRPGEKVNFDRVDPRILKRADAKASVERDATPKVIGSARTQGALTPLEAVELERLVERQKLDLMSRWYAEERLRAAGTVPPVERAGVFNDLLNVLMRQAPQAGTGVWFDLAQRLPNGQYYLDTSPPSGYRMAQLANRASENGALLTQEMFESSWETTGSWVANAQQLTLTGLPVKGSIVSLIVSVTTAPTGASSVVCYIMDMAGATPAANPDHVVDAFTITVSSTGVLVANVYSGEDSPYLNKDDDATATNTDGKKKRQLYAYIIENGSPSSNGAYKLRLRAYERA